MRRPRQSKTDRFFLYGLFAVVIALLFVAGSVAGIFATGGSSADPPLPTPTPPSQDPGIVEPGPDEPEPEPEPDIRTMTLLAVGDITAHLTQINQAHLGDDEYDFTPSFEIIAPYIEAVDLSVGSLETCQASPSISFMGYTGYTAFPCFNAPLALSEALTQAGFDLMAMANNHSLDRGLTGLKETLENVRGLGLTTFGTHLNEEEQMTPVIKEFNGINVAFLSYTFSTNAIPVPQGHEYSVNYIENFNTVVPIVEEMERARRDGADLIAIYMHWGAMYVTEPHPHLRTVAGQLAEAGADLILGSHPHVVQPMEWFYNEEPDGSTRISLATYSMGNFVSNQHYPANPTDLVQYGKILNFEISKDMESGATWISGVDYEITWVHRGWRHRILPLSDVMVQEPAHFNLTAEQKQELVEGYARNKEIIERYGFVDDAPPGVID